MVNAGEGGLAALLDGGHELHREVRALRELGLGPARGLAGLRDAGADVSCHGDASLSGGASLPDTRVVVR